VQRDRRRLRRLDDEDFVSQPTSCGIGACAATGATSCVGGAVQDSCIPGLPGDELCDGTDNDCDGSTDEETGPRYVATTGSDAGNLCTVEAAPCATIGRAVLAACAGETVNVAEGTYAEDVTIDKPLVVDGSGIAPNTQLTGTNTRDVLRILSSGVTWDGVEVSGAPGHACVRVGDPAHPALRDVFVQNMAAYGCRQGVLLDSTGSPPRRRAVEPAAGGRPPRCGGRRDARQRRRPAGDQRERQAGGKGQPGPQQRRQRRPVQGPRRGSGEPDDRLRRELRPGNGFEPIADGRAGIEIADASDVRFEGNDVSLHTGAAAGDDGRGIVLTDVATGTFYCNRIRQNDTGLNARGSTAAGVLVEQSRFINHGFAGVLVEAPALLTIGRSVIQGNATGAGEPREHRCDRCARELVGRGQRPGSRRRGRPGQRPGRHDRLHRARDRALARPAACRLRLGRLARPVLPAPAARDRRGRDGDLVLAGPGTYYEHVTLAERVDIDGTAAPAGCPLTVIDATQNPGEHLPGMRVTGVTGWR